MAEMGSKQRLARLNHISQLLKRGQAGAAIELAESLLKEQPADVQALHFMGLGYLEQKQLPQAEAYLSRAIHAAPGSPNILNDLGIVKMRQAAYDDAVNYFSKALQINPMHSDALNNIAATFTILRQPGKARGYLDRLIQVLPFSSDAHTKAADNSLALNDVEQAIRRGRRAVRLGSQYSVARLSLAECLEAGGRFKQAKFQYLSILSREPDHAAALSKLLSQKISSPLAEQYERHALRLTARGALPDPDNVQLCLGLARYYDQKREYDRSFRFLSEANKIRFRNHPFDSSAFTRAVDRMIDTFSVERVRSLQFAGPHSVRPIFIVGMPRSGTTLIEQVLASHSRVAAGGELPTIINIAGQTVRGNENYPESVRALKPDFLKSLAAQYLDKLAAVSSDAVNVTDKMPFNFMHLGLIRVLFPGAKIIHCRRDARDTCISCFFTDFSEGLQFTSDLEALGRYYVDYRRLMAHWRTVLAAPILELQYERLIGRTEETVRDLLNHCELEWENSCLQFYKTKRGVRTPSAWQVRQPIYDHSVGRWRHYERHLQPLLDILAPVLEEDMHDASTA